jgi:hypothetical protein
MIGPWQWWKWNFLDEIRVLYFPPPLFFFLPLSRLNNLFQAPLPVTSLFFAASKVPCTLIPVHWLTRAPPHILYLWIANRLAIDKK